MDPGVVDLINLRGNYMFHKNMNRIGCTRSMKYVIGLADSVKPTRKRTNITKYKKEQNKQT